MARYMRRKSFGTTQMRRHCYTKLTSIERQVKPSQITSGPPKEGIQSMSYGVSIAPVHYQPHGISFTDATAQDDHGETNVANTELVVRIWCQITNNEQPARAGPREPLIPVPKVLALFLAAKREDMYREESLTQAIALLYAYITARGNSQLPPR